MNQQFTIEMTTYRCNQCNRYYSVETRNNANDGAKCPCCAKYRINELERQQVDIGVAHERELSRMKRCLAAQKAATTRAKKGRAR